MANSYGRRAACSKRQQHFEYCHSSIRQEDCMQPLDLQNKFNYGCSIEIHKTRLVVRDFTQTFGVDYKETIALVAKMNTVKVLLFVVMN
ncbi:hypothetical protein DVH24_009761 [Malus domestica]|uniref:Uncharacterized protein n=1 Tax=Malus domestica TaxID=3750 RepID=A0A498KHG1_MALDO|nr:hypothetical protein DVH24_009761 [Malus domestica]